MTNETREHFARRVELERTVLRYSVARERSNFDAMLSILTDAENDPELEMRLMEYEDMFLQDESEAEMSAAVDVPDLPGILAAAKALGLKPVSLAKSVNLDISVLTKLDRRLIDPRTIPAALIDRLAVVLKRQADQIAALLRLPPTLALASMYKAAASPTVMHQPRTRGAGAVSAQPVTAVGAGDTSGGNSVEADIARGGANVEADSARVETPLPATAGVDAAPASVGSPVPEAHGRESFADAVAGSAMTDEDKRVWLA